MDDDDWGLCAEQLDFLEADALRKISEKKASSSSSSAAAFPAAAAPPGTLERSPSKPHISGKVEAIFPSRGPASNPPVGNRNNSASDMPKISIKLLLHATGRIAAKFPYNPLVVGACHKIPKAAWLSNDRLWVFPLSSLPAAEEVFNGLTSAKIEVQPLEPLLRRAIAAAESVPDLRGIYDRMPGQLEEKLLPFQRDGIRFLLQHGARALLADEMGLGKTLQAIAVAACLRDSWPVLVVTPSSLRLQWASMIQQWLNIDSEDILVVLSQNSGSNRAGFKTVYLTKVISSTQLDGIFNIISYDAVPKLQGMLLASDFKMVIADESHFLKNAQAKRTNATVPILKKSQYAILLSGTPALSRPIELFKQLEALYPDVYRNVHEYGNRYCKGGIFGLYQGASNHEELHNLMKATVMIRRLKKDVMAELPVKRRQQVFLDLDEKDMKQIRILFRELEMLKVKIRDCESVEEAGALKFSQKTLINKIYNDSAQAKIPAVLDYLATVIEADVKFLVFAYHLPMIESIHQFLLKKKVGCIRIDGNTPTLVKQALVNDFQEKDAVRVAVLSIKAAGIGLTLTAASTVIFAELSWTPGDLIQAEDRSHRIGQVSSVNVYYLLANGTVDDIIWDVVQTKLDNLGLVLDGEENVLEVTSEASGSLAKQMTLDPFLKRCRQDDDAAGDGHPEHKRP